jgi:hypothetical protein
MSASNRLNAMGILATGLAVTSTATPALNGTYLCTDDAITALQCQCDSLTRNSGTFVDGTTSVNWPDKTGAGHTFTVAQFGTLINAINLFVVQCYQYATGISTTPPTGSATIP